jgi:hypothetical protein
MSKRFMSLKSPNRKVTAVARVARKKFSSRAAWRIEIGIPDSAKFK